MDALGRIDSVVVAAGIGLCAAVLVLIVFSGSSVPGTLACTRARVPGGREPAFRARYTTGAVRGLSFVPVVAVGVSGAGLATGIGGTGTAVRWGGALAGLAALVAVLYVGRGGAVRHFYVALTPSGLVLRPPGYRAFVPWEAVADVVMLGKPEGSPQGLGLVLRSRDAVGADPLDRARLRFRRPRRADIAVTLQDLDADPRSLVHAVAYYLDHERRRPDVGGREELQRLERMQQRDLYDG